MNVDFVLCFRVSASKIMFISSYSIKIYFFYSILTESGKIMKKNDGDHVICPVLGNPVSGFPGSQSSKQGGVSVNSDFLTAPGKSRTMS